MASKLSENLRLYRKKAMLSQTQVAQKLNKAQQTYAQYENGIAEPSSDTLVALSKIFNVSIDNLLGNEDLFTPDPHPDEGTVTVWGYGTGKTTVKFTKEELAIIDALIKAKKS